MTLTEKRQKRGQLVEQMRAVQKQADDEKRAMTAEEAAQFDKIDGEQETLRVEIDAEDKRRSRLASFDDEEPRKTSPGHRPAPAPDDKPEPRALAERLEKLGLKREYRAALLARDEALASSEYDSTFRSYIGSGDIRAVRSQLQTEKRTTMQVDVFTKGGALQAPTLWLAELLKGVDDLTFVRRFARRFPVMGAASLGVVSLDADVDDWDWTTEIKTVVEDAGIALGNRELHPHPLSKEVKISNDLLRKVPASEALARERLAYKYGLTWEKACLTGDGVRKPLGVFTASADGIPTSRDVSIGNSTTDIGADGLIEAKHAVKSAYWANLRWLFHRDAVKRIRKLKDGNGQYLWNPGLVGNIPDRILEAPYDVSEHVPNTFTTGLYVGLIGDWSFFWIADSLDFMVQVVDQLYARTNQTGFIGRGDGDGAPVLAEAFARVKLA